MIKYGCLWRVAFMVMTYDVLVPVKVLKTLTWFHYVYWQRGKKCVPTCENKISTSLLNSCQNLRLLNKYLKALFPFLKALLLKSTPKLLLIWTNKAAGKIKPDPPLPLLVQKALKVLPSLDWTSGNSERRTGDFWRSLKKLLPSDKSGY